MTNKAKFPKSLERCDARSERGPDSETGQDLWWGC